MITTPLTAATIFFAWYGQSVEGLSCKYLCNKSASTMMLCVVTCLFLQVGCGRSTPDESSPIVSLHTELGGSAQGFERACVPVDFHFPADHAAHPSFRNEWWYFTGNVTSNKGKRFGFHVTFFRIATRPDSAEASALSTPSSSWATRQFYMGHFAITESGTSALAAHERFARAAAGLAGATSENEHLRVWLDDWSIEHRQSNPTDHSTSTWQLSLQAEDEFLQLSLQAQKPVVEQGINGYSQKSSDPCNSSYYYSIPRLQVEGTIGRDGWSHEVTGSAWLDREWSSSALSDNQVGWDWFALQLDDGRDIMFYRLRQQGGLVDSHSHAVMIDPSGVKTVLTLPDYEIDRWWQSPSGARYPVAGNLTFNTVGSNSDSDNNYSDINRKQIQDQTQNRPLTETIHFTPLIDNQELNLTVRYWEGAIELTNSVGDAIGKGYLELTGY